MFAQFYENRLGGRFPSWIALLLAKVPLLPAWTSEDKLS